METKFANIQNFHVRYLETSGDGGTPIIILHGWGSSSESWRAVAEIFETAGQKTFVPDLPGFGETREPRRPWGVRDYTAFVHNFSRAVGAETFFLAGHSFGGQISIEYAANYPRSAAKLILIAAARVMRRRKLRVRVFRTLTFIGNLIFTIPPLSFLRGLVRRIWYRLTGERDYYSASPLMRKTMSLVLREEVEPALPALAMPTLILWGDEDDVTPLRDGRIIHERVAGSKLHIFKAAGHDLNFKQSGELAQAILKFIR